MVVGTQVVERTVAGETRWAVDPAHSEVEFAVKHMMFSTVTGRFSDVSGTIVVDDASLGRSSVRVTIGAASIDTRDEKRDAHLRSADFFDVDRFPTLTFASTWVEAVAGDRYRVTGDLTIHGVTRNVTLGTTFNGEGVNPWGQAVRGYSAEVTINRKDFGLNWNVALEAGGVLVGDNVKIALDVQASREA